MAKGVYIGVNNVARNVKKENIGINNVARNVESGYIGIGNVAKRFFGTNKLYLYKNGDECTSISGGWALQTNTFYQTKYGGKNTSTKEADHLSIKLARTNTESASYIGGFATKATVNCGQYKKVCIEYTITDANTSAYYYGVLGVSTTANADLGINGYPEPYIRKSNTIVTQKSILELDVSSITDNRYIYVFGHVISSYASITFNVYKVWLE